MSALQTSYTPAYESAEGSSDSECEPIKVIQYDEKRVYKKRIRGGMIAVIVLAIVTGIAVFICMSTNAPTKSNEYDASDAFEKMQYFMRFDHLSDAGNSSVMAAFKAFDRDNDGSLSETEFGAYFELQLKDADVFENIDADEDGIISYPEALVYVQQLNEISAVRENTLKLADVIYQQYGFDYKNDSAEFEKYLEFVTIFMYFEPFDADMNGYIHRSEFVTISCVLEFSAFDAKGDGSISFDDFYNVLYGHDENSWKGQLIEEFGPDYESVMEKIGSTSVTSEAAEAVTVRVSLIEVLRSTKSNENARRLTVTCTTRMVWRCDAFGNCGYEAVLECTKTW